MDIVIVFLYMLIPITCFIGATFLAYHNLDGWGFAGILLGSGFKYTSGG